MPAASTSDPLRWQPYLKIRYRHGGRGWTEGDCFNLLLRFYERELGIELADFPGYPADWDKEGHDYLRRWAGQWGFHQVGEPAFGDVLLISTGELVNHTGIVVDADQGYFLHCGRAGTALANYRGDGHWLRRTYGFYRHQRMTDAR